MSNFINLLSKSKLLLILAGVGLFILFILPIIFTDTSQPQPQTSARPSATTQRILSNFPPAQPQEFNEQSSEQKGSVTIKSNTEGVKATIDAEEITSPNFYAPENTIPFIVNSIPAGKHVLRVSKLGFLNQTLPFEVRTNQLTELTVTMEIDPSSNALENAIEQMPVSTDEYFIEYLDSIGKIQVIIRKAPFETFKQQAIDWFRQRGIDNPESSGVLFYPALNTN